MGERVIYLSGPMKGYPESNYPLFNRVAAELRSAGHRVYNPAEFSHDGPRGSFPLRRAFAEYCAFICNEADTIVLLPGWERSLGVSAELALAKNCGLEVIEHTSPAPAAQTGGASSSQPTSTSGWTNICCTAVRLHRHMQSSSARHRLWRTAMIESERLFLAWAYASLEEINPSNYDHEDVCSMNAASVEVMLAIKARLDALKDPENRSAGLADATNDPADLSSLRKGAEVAPLEWHRVTYGWLAFEEWYRIEDQGSNWPTERYWLYERDERLGKFDTFEQADATMFARHEKRIRSALSPAATPVSEAGGEATGKPSLQVGGIPRAENTGRYLAETNDGRLLYLNHANEWQEMPNALAKPASSPAGGDVREALVFEPQLADNGWGPERSIEFIVRWFYRHNLSDLTKADATADRYLAAIVALSPSTSAAEPVARGADYAGDIAPHDDKARGMAVLRDAYDFDIADDGTLVGLVAGDQGWASTHIRIATPPAPAAVDGQRVKALEWGEHAPPNGKDCFYDHVGAETPFGEYSIEWKSWKANDWPTVDFRGEFLRASPTVDEAKAAAQADYEARIRACLATDKEGA